MIQAHFYAENLPGFLLGLSFVAALFAYVLWRRDRPLRPGAVPSFSATACVTAGIGYVSFPFERVEVWPDALHFKNLGFAVPWPMILAVSTELLPGGLVVVLALQPELGHRSPLTIYVKQPHLLLRSIAPFLPATVAATLPSAAATA